MTACSNCGRELPHGAFFCPDCGARALDYSVGQSDISPSHFNSGMTATARPPMTEPTAPAAETGFGLSPPPPPPEEKRRSSFRGRRALVLAVIAALAVLLVGTTFESGMLGPASAPAVNSASTPMTGGQLYAAYAADGSSFTNKTVYVQDSLDSGVSMDSSTGQYYSTVDSGNVILFWSSQSLPQLVAGATVLAKCSVDGEQFLPGAGYFLVLQDCAVVSAQSQASTTTSVSVSVANL